MDNIILPPELSSSLSSENKDFAVKAGRAKPLKQSFPLILFGTIWTVLTSAIGFGFFGPLLSGKEVNFTLNGVSTIASPDNLDPIALPAVAIGFFALIGIVLLLLGIYFLFKEGGYFVGTPTRLVCFQKGKIRSIDWEQFSGDIEVSGNVQNGNISLQMRTGRTVRRKNGSHSYIPDVIYILGIPNAFEIEQICRKRIKENDPTPATEHNACCELLSDFLVLL